MSAILSRAVALVAMAAYGLLPMAASAVGIQAYTKQAFAAAQDAGKPVLVEIHADWCPTCKAQAPILGKLSAERAFAGLVRLRVDFDTQKDVLKQFKVRQQSTLVLFRGKTEVARSTGETDEVKIKAMLQKAV